MEENLFTVDHKKSKDYQDQEEKAQGSWYEPW
jgi:hypothetical protein